MAGLCWTLSSAPAREAVRTSSNIITAKRLTWDHFLIITFL
jgi:hypothetical protein